MLSSSCYGVDGLSDVVRVIEVDILRLFTLKIVVHLTQTHEAFCSMPHEIRILSCQLTLRKSDLLVNDCVMLNTGVLEAVDGPLSLQSLLRAS